jgi:hypothetical protein
MMWVMSWAVLDELDFDAVASDTSVACGVFEQVGRVVARADVTLMSDDELLAGVGAGERTRRQLDASQAHMLAELETRGVTDERRGLSTGQWLAWETHEPIPQARRRVGLAVAMRDEFPAVDQAMVDNQISQRHANVLVGKSNPRIVELYQLKLPWLIGLAQELAFTPWVREVALVAARLDFDGGYRPEDDPEGSKLFIDRLTGDDVTLIRGVFTGPTGTTFTQIVEERTDQLWHRYKHDNKISNGAIKVPTRPVIRAEALIELVTEARAADPTKSKTPVTDLTVVLRWDVSDLFPNGLTPDSAHSGGATLDSLLAAGRYQNRRIPDVYETFDGCDHCGAVLQDRLCDPAIRFLTTDAEGCPLNLGRTVRFASDDQRKVAKARDGGCTFPGCDRPGNWCDAHHVDPYSDGGPSNIANFACLCRFHHSVTHRKGWRMFATHDQWFWWETPNGDTFWSQRHQQQHPGPAPPAR